MAKGQPSLSAEARQRDALSASFTALRHALLAYLRKQVSDASTAEDLLQEVFLKAIAAGQKGESPHNLTGWLYAVARNTVVDFYRSKRPSEALHEDFPAEGASDELLREELSACLRPLAQKIPAIYRDTLMATDFDGRTMQSLAAEWNLSVSAIKSRASRGRGLLKERLLACCHVELSADGAVADYHVRSSATCREGGECK